MGYAISPVKGKSLDDLSFFVGSWQGNAGDDSLEEHWMAAAHGNMTGMFRWIKNGEVYIHELLGLVEKNREILLYLRHFDKDFVGREEKGTPAILHLTETGGRRAVFTQRDHPEKGWIVYEVTKDDRLKFSNIEPDGSRSLELVFGRQRSDRGS